MLVLRAHWPAPGLSFVIPSGNVGSNFYYFDQSSTCGGFLAFVGVKQWQVSGPLEAVMRGKDILGVDVLVIIGHL
jgi:hypothetical protein